MFGFLNSELSQDDGKVFSCMLANQSAYIRGITLYIFRYTGQADGLIIVRGDVRIGLHGDED